MDDKIKKNLFLGITYLGLLALVIIYFTPIMQGIGKVLVLFKTFFIGLSIAFILNKPCMSIERLLNKWVFKNRRNSFSRGISITITYILFILIVTMLISFVIPQLIISVQVLLNNIGSYSHNLQMFITTITDFLGVDKVKISTITAIIPQYVSELGSSITVMLSQVVSITTSILSFVSNLLISIVFSIYFLSGKESLLRQSKKFFRTYLPEKIFRKASYVYYIVIDTFNKYVIGQLIEAVIIGALCAVGMLIFRFEYPLLIGVLIGITALVPVVGAYIGGFISFILLLMINPTMAFWFILFLIVVQQFEGNVIYPRVVGSSLGLPSILILLSITIGGGLAGPMGILLGIPIATVLYILLKNDIKNRAC